MQKLKLISTILLSVILLSACSGNSTANVGKETVSSSANASSNSSSNVTGDKGTYSYTVAGKKVDEKGTLMEGFKANLNTSDGTEVLSLVLTNASAEDGSVSSFMIAVPNKTGTTTFTKDNDKVNDTAYSCVYTGSANHGADVKIDPHVNSITINVEQLSDKRASGTFSGTVIGEDGSTILPVTDGKFNLPIYKLGSN